MAAPLQQQHVHAVPVLILNSLFYPHLIPIPLGPAHYIQEISKSFLQRKEALTTLDLGFLSQAKVESFEKFHTYILSGMEPASCRFGMLLCHSARVSLLRAHTAPRPSTLPVVLGAAASNRSS